MSNFKEVFSTKATDLTPVHKYRSEKTGLTLVICDVEGPIVNSYICLATEAHDDDGLPHTLEHLIFLGSEEYPYKGLLDLLANKCLAEGTNAWTDTDHTAYTVMTAGSEGMLALLPIYLDHVLYPVITDHGFVTEVHHITGEGTDAGVVYCEMQGRENQAYSRCMLKLLQGIYENSGYCSETGGLMHNLRVSTTNEKVKAYHAEFYRPENVTVILTGQITPEEVFKAIQPIEDKIIAKGQLPPFVRPWQTPVPPLTAAKVVNMKYPTDCEDCGLVNVAWRGPCISDPDSWYEYVACTILLNYLCVTPAAPLQKALVEVDNPYASNVCQGIFENSVTAFMISLSNVPLNRLQEALPVLKKCIASVADGTDPIDVERMKRIIQKQLREIHSHIERMPHESIAFMCISDMLHAKSDEQFDIIVNKQRFYRRLENENAEFWTALLKKYLGETLVAVIGTPSTELMQQMAEEEEQRTKSQIEELGKEGLAKKAKELEDAMEYNGREVPEDVLKSVNMENLGDFKYHKIETWKNGESPCPYFPLQDMPFFTRISNVHTHFVYMSLFMNTSEFTPEQRQWLPLLVEVLVESPLNRDGKLIPHDDVLADIETFTEGIDLEIGVKNSSRFSPGTVNQVVVLSTQCEPDKYEKVIKLTWEIMKKTVLTRERLLIVAQKMINDVASLRREGDSMVTELIRDLNYSDKSNIHWCSILRQQRFLTKLIPKLETEEKAESVLTEIESVRALLTAPENIWLAMAANLEVNKLTTEPWNIFISGSEKPSNLKHFTILNDSDQLVEASLRQGSGCIVGMGGVESCFIEQYSPGPLSNSHPDVPGLLVALQYFTQLEGPMWRLIRGAGLSYSYSLVPVPLNGFIKFTLYKATNASAAYLQAKNIITSFLESGTWDENLFASAKSSLIFGIVNRVSAPAGLIVQSIMSHFYNVDEDFNKKMVRDINNITMDEALKIARRWLPGVFNPKESLIAIVCHTSKVTEVEKEFAKIMGINLKKYNTLEQSHLARGFGVGTESETEEIAGPC